MNDNEVNYILLNAACVTRLRNRVKLVRDEDSETSSIIPDLCNKIIATLFNAGYKETNLTDLAIQILELYNITRNHSNKNILKNSTYFLRKYKEFIKMSKNSDTLGQAPSVFSNDLITELEHKFKNLMYLLTQSNLKDIEAVAYSAFIYIDIMQACVYYHINLIEKITILNELIKNNDNAKIRVLGMYLENMISNIELEAGLKF